MAAFRECREAAHERRESAVHDQAGNRIAVDQPQSGHQADQQDEDGKRPHEAPPPWDSKIARIVSTTSDRSTFRL